MVRRGLNIRGGWSCDVSCRLSVRWKIFIPEIWKLFVRDGANIEQEAIDYQISEAATDTGLDEATGAD